MLWNILLIFFVPFAYFSFGDEEPKKFRDLKLLFLSRICSFPLSCSRLCFSFCLPLFSPHWMYHLLFFYLFLVPVAGVVIVAVSGVVAWCIPFLSLCEFLISAKNLLKHVYRNVTYFRFNSITFSQKNSITISSIIGSFPFT